MLPVTIVQDEMGELLDSLRDKDEDVFHRWTKSEAWATVEQLMEADGIASALLSLSTVFIGFLGNMPSS